MLRGESNGRDGENDSILVSGHFILKHFETDLQMLHVNNIEKGLARLGCTIEHVLNVHDCSGNRGGDGAIRQLALQYVQLGLYFIVATADTRHVLDILWCSIQVVVLIALSHQYGLILEFGFLQSGTGMGNLVAQGHIAQSRHDLTFIDILTGILYGKIDYLLCYTAIDRNLVQGFYLTLDSG